MTAHNVWNGWHVHESMRTSSELAIRASSSARVLRCTLSLRSPSASAFAALFASSLAAVTLTLACFCSAKSSTFLGPWASYAARLASKASFCVRQTASSSNQPRKHMDGRFLIHLVHFM